MERIKKYEPLWGKWTVKRIIGEGSFGAVYEAESEKFGNRSFCAVKLISFKNAEMLQGVKDGETLSSEELEQLKIEEARKNVREAVLMEKLQGRDHIVTIYDYDIFPGETTTDVIIRMELLTNLNDYMKQHTTDSESDLKSTVIKLGIDIGKALEDCEEEKIVHRDIKPDNIFVNKNRTFKLGDFGLSRKMSKSASFSLRKSAGTPLYMAPETFGWGSKTDYQSDIYSLGIVMYQLLNDGNIPFVSDMRDFTEVDNAIGRRLDKEKILPPKYEHGALWKVLQKACEFEKKDRYQEAREFRKTLEKLKNESKVEQKKEQEEGKNESVKEENQKLNEEIKKTEIGLNVGESICFGTYPQKVDGTKQPIEWTVLKETANSILLISKYILDVKPYDKKDGYVAWENSDIREWLNNKFYTKAFNLKERKKIQETVIKAEDNYGQKIIDENTVIDKVFLLSVDEVERLFLTDKDKRAMPTEYASKMGVETWNGEELPVDLYPDDNGYSLWWIRSRKYDGVNLVYYGGWFSNTHTDSNDIGVRPAIWVEKNFIELLKKEQSVKKMVFNQEEKNSFMKKEAANSDLSKKNIGNTMFFGSYPQTKNGDKKPIEWLILKKEKNKALLLSKYILDAERYHKKFKNVTWQTSDIRSWLNNEFYKNAFTGMEQKRIQDVLVKTESNPSYGTYGGSTTKDKVFLLSIHEAEELISNDEIRKAEATEYAKKTGVYINDKTGGTLWWLRSPGYDGEHAAGVDFRGWVYTDGYGIDSSYDGIRPAIWLSLEE